MRNQEPIKLAYIAPALTGISRALLRGICKYTSQHSGFHLRMSTQSLETVLPKLKPTGVNAAFVYSKTPEHTEMALETGIPCVNTHVREIPQIIPYISANNEVAGRMVAEHFLDRGFTNFAYYSLSNHIFWSNERLAGYTDRLARNGYEVTKYDPPETISQAWAISRDVLHAPLSSSWTADAQHLYDWLRSLPKPIAIMACDDALGYDLIEAAQEAGIRVPEEIAVAGVYNDTTICQISNPPLSSVAVDVEHAGYSAAELLHNVLLGKAQMQGQRIYNQPTHIVTRQSSDILAVTDPEICAALHFIRTNFDQPIQVMDIVRATTVSRRSLEKKFCERLDRSIMDEVMRTKVDYIIRLLIESDMPMDKIASSAAFCSTSHMIQTFRKFRDMTPLVFRRTHRSY